MAEETVDPSLLEQTKNQIRKLVQEIAELAESDIQPSEFQGEFLNRVIAAVAASGGALWMLDGRGSLKLQYQYEFRHSGLMDGRVRTQPHDGLLACMLQTSQAQIIPPGAAVEGVQGAGNPTPYALIIAPLVVDKQIVGLVEVLMDPNRRAATQKSTLRFVSDLCDLAARYLKNRQMRQIMSQQQMWNQLEGFTHGVHSTLNLKETAFGVVNDGKRLVTCDRLSVALKIAGRVAVEAVSGQEVVEQRANLIRELNKLCKAVIQSGEDLLYTGDTEGFTPDVRDALEIYVDESGAKGIVITLLRKPESDPNKDKTIFGCLIAEQMGDETAISEVQAKSEVVARHASTALWNAQEFDRIFLMPLLKTIGSPLRFFRGRTLAKILAVVGVILAVILIMALVPFRLTVWGDGSLMPEERTTIYAPVPGIVTEVFVEHGAEVEKGALLLRLRNRDLEKELDQLLAERNTSKTEQTRLEREIADSKTRYEERLKLQGEKEEARIRADSASSRIELIQEQMELMEVRSPFKGIITTWEVKKNLLNRPVEIGHEMLQVANPDGKWVLEVNIPDDDMAPILAAQQRLEAEKSDEVAAERALAKQENRDPVALGLPAYFITGTDPSNKYPGEVVRIASKAELNKENTHVVKVTVSFSDEVRAQFLERNEEFRPGAGVRAGINCGKARLAYCIFRDVVHVWYETVLFRWPFI